MDVGKAQVVDRVPKVIKELQFGILSVCNLFNVPMALMDTQIESRYNQSSRSRSL